MANPDKINRDRIGSSPSCFLGCFGFSRKSFLGKPMVSPDGGEKKRRKKKNRWFSWSEFRLKNSKLKPSPVNEAEKSNESDKQKTAPVISPLTDRKNIPADDDAEIEETNTNKRRHVISDRPEHVDPSSPSKSDTFHKRVSTSARAKPDPIKPGELETIPNRVRKFDPVVGVSIMMVMLAIMLIWGLMCAILCASAFGYFLPRLQDAAAKRKRKRERGGGAESGPDLNSEAYKRKVVLEGFLGRNNRVTL